MMQHIHLDPKFQKRLGALRKAGKKAGIAAQKVDDIIARLALQGFVLPEEVGTVTKYGEARLKNCIKYDLGNGYRLITLKNAGELFVLYVGTHDECHRWVENNRELRLDQVRPRCDSIPITSPVYKATEKASSEDETDAVDDLVERIENLSDRDLRMIFCGLVGAETT